MRILWITYFYPPTGAIGALRAGKMTKYLSQFGHEVFVVTVKTDSMPKMPIEISMNRIIRTGREMHKLISGMVSWYPFAYRAASRLVRDWRPDIIYASALPYYPLLVAYRVSQEYGIPWVAEFRDLWMDNHYDIRRGLRKFTQKRLERRLLLSAAGLVTVSKPMAEILANKSGKPVKVIPNGFDPHDYPVECNTGHDPTRLDIVYAGTLYEGKRDPSPLFKALKLMGSEANRICFSYFGPDGKILSEIVEKHGMNRLVKIGGCIDYRESLRKQCEADVLLLLLWDNPMERGVFTGKLFEYIGARRPILAIGPDDNVAMDLIRERGIGAALNDPARIAEQLHLWLDQKQNTGVIPSLPVEATTGLSREEEAREVERFLMDLITTPCEPKKTDEGE